MNTRLVSSVASIIAVLVATSTAALACKDCQVGLEMWSPPGSRFYIADGYEVSHTGVRSLLDETFSTSVRFTRTPKALVAFDPLTNVRMTFAPTATIAFEKDGYEWIVPPGDPLPKDLQWALAHHIARFKGVKHSPKGVRDNP